MIEIDTMSMSPKQDINYLLKINKHAQTEMDLGIDPHKRVLQFLWTKSDASIQEAKQKLLDELQTPPTKFAGETDAAYIVRFNTWDAKTQQWETLLDYIK